MSRALARVGVLCLRQNCDLDVEEMVENLVCILFSRACDDSFSIANFIYGLPEY